MLEQTGTAKKLTGQILENWLVSFADGHGGIQTIAKTGTSGLVDTYTITYADTTTSTFTVTNGKAITSITQYWAVSTSGSTVPSQWYTTRQTMTPTNKYLWSYMTITYNDSTTEDTTKSVVGVYGDTGAQTYVWIKYAAIQPTSDADMGDVPDNWIGIYTGLSSSAPTSYTAYAWYEYKGEKGDTGDASTITSQSVTYQEGTSGTIAPSGTWTPTIPIVTAGNFLWTRTILEFNDLSTVTAYSVSRFGIDGTGSVSTVNSISPDTNGNVALTATNIPTSDNTSVQEHIDALTNDYLPLTAGDGKPLTGYLALKNTNYAGSDTPSSTSYEGITFQDKNGDAIADLISMIGANNNGLRLEATWNGVSNRLNLFVSKAGTPTVSLTNPAAWLSALGLGTSGALPITIAQGGTGSTQITDTATASSIITPASGITVSNAHFQQWGKVGTLYLELKSSSAITASGVNVGTLVTGKRPSYVTSLPIATPAVAGAATIGGSGVITVRAAISANVSFVICGTFLIA